MSESNPIADVAKVGAARSSMWGIILLILGMLAIAAPFVAGTATVVLFGVILAAAGIVLTVAAFGARSGAGGVFALLLGIVMALAGLVIVARPLIGLASITLALAIYLLVDGIFQIIASVQARPQKGWGWSAFGGILSLLLALLIWRQWPSSALWFVGVVVGVRLLFAGWGLMMLGGAQAAVAETIERA
jgi:uncharacterized membrane protein HdeD (DUF308 family)